MKTKAKIVLLLFFIGLYLPNTKAQITVNTEIDTNVFLIGDQTKVTFKASFPDSVSVLLPLFSDTIINKLEIIDIYDIDTTIENGIYNIEQEYLVTSFDSGSYTIPPANFIIHFPKTEFTDTLKSIAIYFEVNTISIDTSNMNAITDIKAPVDAPITFKEVAPFIGIGLGIIILLFLIYILYIKHTKKESIFIKKEKPKEPAHIIALRNLDTLKERKLWQQGKIKEYYSELTDIVRTYIENRFIINAMESTTEEIIIAFKDLDIDKDLKNELFRMLKSADFVKFAKATPLANENEHNLEFVYNFVYKTKPIEVLRDEDNQPEQNETIKE
jgi:hypothetical protein